MSNSFCNYIFTQNFPLFSPIVISPSDRRGKYTVPPPGQGRKIALELLPKKHEKEHYGAYYC